MVKIDTILDGIILKAPDVMAMNPKSLPIRCKSSSHPSSIKMLPIEHNYYTLGAKIEYGALIIDLARWFSCDNHLKFSCYGILHWTGWMLFWVISKASRRS